jgi:CelD/BcsL family acetyltransferase involved in cellulose biosynthesis
VRVVPVTQATTLEAHADAWMALLERSAANRPTRAPFWLLAWWQVFGSTAGRRMASALFYEGDRLVGVAPLLRRVAWYRRAVPFRRLELLATGESEADEIVSDYLGVIAERGFEQPVAEALAAEIRRGTLGPCDEVVLSALDGDDPMVPALAGALGSQQMVVEQSAATPSPYIKLPATWEAYLAGLSGSGRYLVNRSLRDFDKWAKNDVEVVRVQTPADLEQGKRILVMLHEQRWKSSGEAGVFASQLFTRFHDMVLPALLERGALDLCWLNVRDQPIAVAYNLIWDNKVLFYQGGRTLEVPKAVRPGIVLHARSIRAAIEAGRSEYDFLAGMSQYKLQLSTARRPMLQIRAARAPVRDVARLAIELGAAAWRARRTAAAGSKSAEPASGGDPGAA